MSTTTSDFPGTFSPPPRNTAPADNADDQPKSSSLYLFTFLSTLFLLLVVSTAIVLRSFLLRRRYRMGLQEQFDDIFRRPGDPPGASRRRNFGIKPKLWDAWIRVDDQEKNSASELANIKPLAVMYVPQERTEPKNKASTSSVPQLEQERRHERPSAFLAGLFAHPLPLPRHPYENDRPESGPAYSSAEISRTIQVSVVISMPMPNHKKPPVSDNKDKEFPNVAIGFTRLPFVNE